MELGLGRTEEDCTVLSGYIMTGGPPLQNRNRHCAAGALALYAESQRLSMGTSICSRGQKKDFYITISQNRKLRHSHAP